MAPFFAGLAMGSLGGPGAPDGFRSLVRCLRNNGRKSNSSCHPFDGLSGIQEPIYLSQSFQTVFSALDKTVVQTDGHIVSGSW